jgi:hypothetical protein
MIPGHENGCTEQGNLPSMASPDKQQKRAQRAKAKAKQNRSGKGKPSPQSIRCSTIPSVNEPFDDVYPRPEQIRLQRHHGERLRARRLRRPLPGHAKPLKSISLLAMCVVFLQYPVLELVIAEEEEDPATDFLMALLIAYRGIFHDEEEDVTVEWLGSDTNSRTPTTKPPTSSSAKTHATRVAVNTALIWFFTESRETQKQERRFD